jgi:hypothetical protein
MPFTVGEGETMPDAEDVGEEAAEVGGVTRGYNTNKVLGESSIIEHATRT